MKIPRTIKEDWKIHFGWTIAFTMLFAFGMLLWSHQTIKRLRIELRDSQQTLKECQHTNDIWRSQVKSGSVKIYKETEDGKEIIERWEMEK